MSGHPSVCFFVVDSHVFVCRTWIFDIPSVCLLVCNHLMPHIHCNDQDYKVGHWLSLDWWALCNIAMDTRAKAHWEPTHNVTPANHIFQHETFAILLAGQKLSSFKKIGCTATPTIIRSMKGDLDTWRWASGLCWPSHRLGTTSLSPVKLWKVLNLDLRSNFFGFKSIELLFFFSSF